MRDALDGLLVASILGGLGFGLWSAASANLFAPMIAYANEARWARLIVEPGVIWAIVATVMLVLRTLFWLRYRPQPPASPRHAPSLTVIIPAYNEGPMVAQSIDSVAQAHYPDGKLEIFVVDDGSRDDTWEHIEKAAARHKGLVTALRFPENRGKRAALAAGFARARGDIAITVDSDSEITPGTLLAIAGPFRNPRVGAVAGKVTVLNERDGLIPRMLKVRYVLSFDFLRASQSVFRTVYTCPGALAAYRLNVVRKVLDKWLNQRFLGARCTFGEDRALTNWILSEGYDALYQRTAVVRTIVPVTYRQLSRMFLRWDRSYVREDLRLARIVWRRPWHLIPLILADKLVTNLRFPIGYAMMALVVFLALQEPFALLRFYLAVGAAAAFYSLFYLRSERSWDAFYGVVYGYYAVVGLSWIMPWAMMTVRSRSWLTR